MKKRTSIFLVLLSLILLAVSPSYASDNNTDYMIMAKLSIEGDYDSSQNSMYEEEAKSQSSEYYNISNKNYVSLRNVYKQKEERVVTDSSFRSYIAEGNIPDSLVNNVTFEFSRNRKQSPGFDMGLPSSFSDILQIGAAFMTNLTAHEVGHEVVAGHVGAKGSDLNFFKKQNGSFFLGTSTVTEIDKESKLPYHMGGEFFADMTFEHALKEYRENPSSYNKALMLFSGTDFVWYCMYAFYLTDGHAYYDPISIQKETGLSKDTIFTIALAKTLVNTFRIYSGEDKVIPYFSVDKNSASLKVAIPF